MKRKYLNIALWISLISVFGCTTSENISKNITTEQPITIYVSNDKGIEPVNILVKIYEIDSNHRGHPNEKVIIDQEFSYKTYSPTSLNLKLKEGMYVFHIETNKGNYKLNVTVDVNKPLWLFLSYLEDNFFQFDIRNQQPVFG